MEDNATQKSIIENLRHWHLQFTQMQHQGSIKPLQLTRLQQISNALLERIYGKQSTKSNRFFKTSNEQLSESELLKRFEINLNALGNIIKSLEAVASQVEIYASGVKRIFVGHGRNPIWNRVVTFLKDELHYEVEAFETESRTSQHIVDVLKQCLEKCHAAVIVMTADDLTHENKLRARQNVIHEIGLFQGRYDFERVILLQQSTVEEFSNISGLQTIRFNDKIEDSFYELQRALNKLSV